MRIVVVLRRTSGGAACGRWIDRFRARSMYVSINHHPWIGELMPATSGGPICIQRYSVEYPKFVPKKFVYTVCTSTCILEKAKKSKKLSYQKFWLLLLLSLPTDGPTRPSNTEQAHHIGIGKTAPRAQALLQRLARVHRRAAASRWMADRCAHERHGHRTHSRTGSLT
jgi:hypothetical protein